MADEYNKLTDPEILELEETPADGDLLHIIDISDTTDDLEGSSKRITFSNLIGHLATLIGLNTHIADTNNPHEVGMSELSDYNANSNKITNVTDPTSDQEAATKIYVDTAVTEVQDAIITGFDRQALINGNFDIWQRFDNNTTLTAATRVTNNDDSYIMDRWILLSDGNDIVDITKSTDKPDGSRYSAKFDVQTAKRFGILQIIPAEDAIKLDNGKVSLSFKAKTDSGEIAALRVAILTWSGTADAPTSDVVGTWGATPTWAASWTAENTPADIAITNSWAEYKVENIDIDSATVNNIAIFIYTPNEESINDTLYLSQVQLNRGETALPFTGTSWDDEYLKCLKFYEQSWTYGTAQANSASNIATRTDGYVTAIPSIRKRLALSSSNTAIYNGSTANQVRDSGSGSTVNFGIIGQTFVSDRGISFYDNTSPPFTANTTYDYNWIIDTEL